MRAQAAKLRHRTARFAAACALWMAIAIVGCSNGSGSSGDPDAGNPGDGGSSDSLSIEPVAAEDFEKFIQELQQPPWILIDASAIVNIQEGAFEYDWSLPGLDEDGSSRPTTAPYACDLFVDQTAIFSFYPSPDDDGFSLLRRNDGAVFWSLTYPGAEWSGFSGTANADQFRGNCSVIGKDDGQSATCVFRWFGEASESQSSPRRKSDAAIEIMCAYVSTVSCKGSSGWDSYWGDGCASDGNQCTFDFCLPNGECGNISKELLSSDNRCSVCAEGSCERRCCREGECIPCPQPDGGVPDPDATELE